MSSREAAEFLDLAAVFHQIPIEAVLEVVKVRILEAFLNNFRLFWIDFVKSQRDDAPHALRNNRRIKAKPFPVKDLLPGRGRKISDALALWNLKIQLPAWLPETFPSLFYKKNKIDNHHVT